MEITHDKMVMMLNAMNQLQVYMSSIDPDSTMYSAIYNKLSKLSRITKYENKLKAQIEGDDLNFQIHETDVIFFAEVEQILPEVKIRSAYENTHRVSWIPKTGFAMINKGKFIQKIGSNPIEIGGGITGASLNFWFEYLAQNATGQDYETILDDIEGDTEYKTRLMQKTLLIPQHFFFSRAIVAGFKKILSLGDFYFKYTFQKKLTSLLRVQALNGAGEWKDIPKDDNDIYCTIGEINSPQIVMTSGLINDEEKKSLWTFGLPPNPSEENKKPLELFNENIYEIVPLSDDDSSIELSGKGIKSIDLNIKGCVRAIFFCIQNLKEVEKGNHFCYSFMEGDREINPIVSVGLMNKYGTKYKNVDPRHFYSRHPRQAKIRTPKVIGMHYMSLSVDGNYKTVGDTNEDLNLLGTKLILSYNIPANEVGKVMIYFEMHRIISYTPKGLKILVEKTSETD
jgi:hypothetical protein